MKTIRYAVLAMAMSASCMVCHAQQTVATNSDAAVPPLVNFSSTLTESSGKPLAGTAAVTFSLYSEQTGGAALWMESQTVQADNNGHYTATLGATSSAGLPPDIFVSGQAHWLGVQVQGQEEQPRVLLVSAPYALKAGDAQTIGGLPPSAFALANPGKQAGPNGSAAAEAKSGAAKPASSPANPDVTGKGTVDYIPMWDTTSDIIDSLIFQKSSEIGINTTTPAALLDVNGNSDVRDTLTLFPKSTDNTLAVSGTAFAISSTGKVTFISGQTFPGTGTITGITTASGSGLSGGGTTGTLSLKVPAAGITNAMLANSKITLDANSAGGLITPGAMTLGSTYTIGLKPCSANQILEYSGSVWNCSSAGTGTITGVTAGTDLTGGGTSGTVTLNLDTTKVPLLASANTFTNSNTINANSSSPALALNNAGSGDGIDVSAPGGIGVSLLSSDLGIQTTSSFVGGNFVSSGGFGSFGESDYDANFNAAAVGSATGETQVNLGVWGYAASPVGIGTYGEGYANSAEGSPYPGTASIGVWGDTSGDMGTGEGIGVLATVDYGLAVLALNNTSGGSTAWLENDEAIDRTSPVLTTDGGSTNLRCVIDVSADLTCDGTVSPAVPINNGAKKVAVYGVASAENWFEDFGSGQLSNGAAIVTLEETFFQTVNTGVEYHVFLTPKGDCKGLYVSQESARSFEVHELGGGTSNIAFDYRITAKRRGFETVRLADRTKVLSAQGPKRRPAGAHLPSPDEVRRAHSQKLAAIRKAAMLKSRQTVPAQR